jgi:hypothetical protein
MDATYAQTQKMSQFERTVEVNSSANDKAKTSRKDEIIINIYDIPRLNEQAVNALEALERYNAPPFIFKRGGSLCRLDEIADGEFAINQINKGALKGILAEAARWTKWECGGMVKNFIKMCILLQRSLKL